MFIDSLQLEEGFFLFNVIVRDKVLLRTAVVLSFPQAFDFPSWFSSSFFSDEVSLYPGNYVKFTLFRTIGFLRLVIPRIPATALVWSSQAFGFLRMPQQR